MRKLVIAGTVALLPLVAAPQPVRADVSSALYTGAMMAGGALIGAAILPTVAPAAAPTVAAAYGTLAAGASQAAATFGNWILAEPVVAGAVIGLLTGLALSR